MINAKFRYVGYIMLCFLICFLWYALGHPEMSFPWDNTVTYALLLIYAILMTMFFLKAKSNIDVHKKRQNNEEKTSE